MAKDYFQSREFKDLLKSYEDQQAAGEGIYLDADDFADIADYYLSMDKPSSSMETLATGLSLHPNDEVLLIVLSAAYIYQRQYDKAEEVLGKLDSGNSDVKYQLAQLEYAKYGRVKQAEKIWREWMKLENGIGGGYHCVWLSEHDKQIFKDRGLSVVSCPASNAKLASGVAPVQEYIDTFQPLGRYDEDVQLADICRDNDLADLMCDVLTQVLEEQPYLPKGWSNLALAQFLLQHYEQAIEACDFALAIDSDDLEALLTKAHSYHSMGEKSTAKPIFKEYLDKGGEAVQIIPYADALFHDGEKDEALSELDRLSNYFENKKAQAVARWQKAQLTRSSDVENRKSEQALYDDFIDLYRRILTDISDLYHHNGYYEESIVVNNRLTEVDQHDSEAYFMLGINNLALSRYEEASRNFAFALQWAEDQVMMGVDIALTFVLNNFDDFALEVLEAVSQIASSSKSPFVKNIPAAKSLTHLKMGHKDLFLQNFKVACRETPDLVRKVYEGYFPSNLLVSQWSDYATKNIDKLMKNFKGENMHLNDFS